MKKIIFLYCTLLALPFISCKKDSGNQNSTPDVLSGNWNFTSLSAQTAVTDEYNIGGDDFKYVTTSSYSSDSNRGTISFASGTATTTGIAYSVSTTLFVSSYENGALVDTTSTPFTISVPSSGSFSSYKLIGTDSVFFANGFVTSNELTGDSAQAATPIGYRFQINGNILTMASAIAKDTVADIGGGVLAQVHEAANFSLTLTKQ
jgi:hypothetical protein